MSQSYTPEFKKEKSFAFNIERRDVLTKSITAEYGSNQKASISKWCAEI